IEDTGVFAQDRYFDVQAEYAKADVEEILIRITITNRGPDEARLHLLPTLWFRNTWSWGCPHEGCGTRPSIRRSGGGVRATHEPLGSFRPDPGPLAGAAPPVWLFTDNETNMTRLFGAPNAGPFVKDAFHERVVHGREGAVNDDGIGTKTALWHQLGV